MPFFKLPERIASFFKRERVPESNATFLNEDLIRNAVEILSDNASLTADLDDNDAKFLLDWAISGVKVAFQNPSFPLEGALDEQIRAVRQMMRTVNNWIPALKTRDLTDNLANLEALAQKMTHIYGADYLPPSSETLKAFLEDQLANPDTDFIPQLRALFEPKNPKAGTHLSE